MLTRILPKSGAVAIAFVLFLAACGGGSSTGGGNQQVTIAISPTTATLNPGQQQQFQATVTGTNDMSVTWQVNNITGGNAQIGTISAGGLYTAPNPGDRSLQVTITAVADANTAKTASAVVTVNSTVTGG
ncbi:MAG TPA: Ig-like domain-containing protein [Verrucomicrobiae bacterium]|jgi:hypothetical protein|nr:Ig-like domain-containing protein [Verrucomicrobiae bacterium]